MPANWKLKAAIYASGRSQREVAESVGLTENDLSRIVRERREATELEQERIAQELGVSVEQIFEVGQQCLQHQTA